MWTKALSFLLLLAPIQALAAGLPAAPPASLGLSPERLARIDDAMKRYVDDGKLAGINIAFARDGKLVYDKSAGMADMARGLPMSSDTLVRIYSMTKAITVVAAMTLVEEGRLRLTDPVSMHLPEFAGTGVYVEGGPDAPKTRPPKTPPKIFHLMTHTSGLTYPGGYDKTVVGKVYDEKNVFDAGNTADQDFGKTDRYQGNWGTRANFDHYTRDCHNITAVRGHSPEDFHDWPTASLDLVFLDGIHHNPGFRDDVMHWYPRLKPGGTLCGDDCARTHPDVLWTIDDFCKERNIPFTVERRIWMLKRP